MATSSNQITFDDDFDLKLRDGKQFHTLYVRIIDCKPQQDGGAVAPDAQRVLADRGSIDAQIGWAHRLLNGDGVERDANAAFYWFKLASRNGDADAINMVGRCYECGWGVESDPSEAARWYQQAADKGHAWAQFNLASLFAQGRGVPVNVSAALSLLVRSTRSGNAKAMNMLGRYREATGGQKGLRAAHRWYRRAAQRGCFRGQFQHGVRLVEIGSVSDGMRWLGLSLSAAPSDFRADALAILRRHHNELLQVFALQQGQAQ